MIKENAQKILAELPDGVDLVAAAKTRSLAEVKQAIEAGVKIVGENYVQEAEQVAEGVRGLAKLHFIGHLQKNKVKKAVEIFDLIETVDSYKLALEINQRCEATGKIMPILIEINSGKEEAKFGLLPEETGSLVKQAAELKSIKIMGLMTMGPRFGNPEDSRIYFKETKKIFDKIKNLNLPGVEMKYLSMGMSNSYKIAIEEGANLVRLGTKIFGERNYD